MFCKLEFLNVIDCLDLVIDWIGYGMLMWVVDGVIFLFVFGGLICVVGFIGFGKLIFVVVLVGFMDLLVKVVGGCVQVCGVDVW